MLALHRDQPGIGISLGTLTLVSVSSPRVADKSHLSQARQSWMWASSCMTQHETCLGAWQPLLRAKGWIAWTLWLLEAWQILLLVRPACLGVAVGRAIP